jgi:predicted transport protein
MMDLKKEIAKMMLEAGERIAQMIASEAFELWQRKDFRIYIEFHKLDQTEQDRIFNELEVSLIGLYVLRLDQAIQNAPQEKAIAFKALKAGIQEGFLKFMGDQGVEQKFVNQWKLLMDIRLKKYREHLKIAMKMSEKDKNLKGKDSNLRPAWARVETIKIDCLSHIRRGKFDQHDPLWKFLTKWFITMDSRLSPITDKL